MDLKSYGDAGRRLASSVLAQLTADGLAPDARDEALLGAAARLADRIHELEAMVRKDGARTIGKTGIVRLHPAIAECRNSTVALAKVLALVALEETSGATKDPAKVHAAQTRWRAHNAAKAAGAPTPSRARPPRAGA